MVKIALVILFALSLLAMFGVGAGMAGEYHCQSGGDRCNVSKSTRSASVYCMKSSEMWQCTLPVVGDVECTAQSETKTFPRAFWYSPTNICTSLCGCCSDGWSEYQGGGSTF